MATREDLVADVATTRVALDEADDVVARTNRDLRIARAAQAALFRAHTEAQDNLDEYDECDVCEDCGEIDAYCNCHD